jgi:glycosyltransferase involved in cell wall biosynthesis
VFYPEFKINLSILIPVFNQDVSALVNALHRQLIQDYTEWEILILEDGSSLEYRAKNNHLDHLPGVTRIIEIENKGRAATRNQLAKTSRFDDLLFLDGDSTLPDESFIKKYATCLPSTGPICGGRIYTPIRPLNHSLRLHWKYGSRIESPASFRQFMSHNFIINRNWMLLNPFDEHIRGYGHEDTLLGRSFLKEKMKIQFIHNPVIHNGLESAAVFLKKSENAIENLRLLSVHTRLTQFYPWIPATWAVGFLPCLRKNLLSNYPSIFIFQLYKWILYRSRYQRKK